MPKNLAALVAFIREHQRCGELDGGPDVDVWLAVASYFASSRIGTNVTWPAGSESGMISRPCPHLFSFDSEEQPAHAPQILHAEASDREATSRPQPGQG
jgi:hypothetical protein